MRPPHPLLLPDRPTSWLLTGGSGMLQTHHCLCPSPSPTHMIPGTGAGPTVVGSEKEPAMSPPLQDREMSAVNAPHAALFSDAGVPAFPMLHPLRCNHTSLVL